MITELTFAVYTYVVAHNNAGLVHYLECKPGTTLGTGQPHVEQFTDETLAIARATELGYVFPDPENLP